MRMVPRLIALPGRTALRRQNEKLATLGSDLDSLLFGYDSKTATRRGR